MMTKILLALIALGLWANALIPLFQPRVAQAQNRDELVSKLSDIQDDLHMLARGTCTNHKLC